MEGLPQFTLSATDTAIVSRIQAISVAQKLTPQQMAAILRKEGWAAPNRYVRRLMRAMGLETRPQQ